MKVRILVDQDASSLALGHGVLGLYALYDQRYPGWFLLQRPTMKSGSCNWQNALRGHPRASHCVWSVLGILTPMAGPR